MELQPQTTLKELAHKLFRLMDQTDNKEELLVLHKLVSALLGLNEGRNLIESGPFYDLWMELMLFVEHKILTLEGKDNDLENRKIYVKELLKI
jgi:hypothetical protein